MTVNHQVPRDLHARNAWVLHQLKLRHSSLAAIARKLDCSRVLVRNALFMPSYPQEQAIADEIGIPIQQLFPERYDARGQRLHRTKDSNSNADANGQNGEAA